MHDRPLGHEYRLASVDTSAAREECVLCCAPDVCRDWREEAEG